MTRNEQYRVLHSGEDFRSACADNFRDGKQNILRTMFASDEREVDGKFYLHAVFSQRGRDAFDILVLPLAPGSLSYPSITPEVPAAHWYEREIKDLFGIVPEGHPDPRPLVLHGMYPEGVHPLRRDLGHEDIRRRLNPGNPGNYEFMKVGGEGVYEIPVGPVHAGIIEPGHFRFSAVGETIYYLEPRLFYTHKGIEKLFEAKLFEEGLALAERVSGCSSFAHSCAYSMAVERAAGIEAPPRALAARTVLLELERLYNHIGDIGNMCAGTGFALGNMEGAAIKEKLMALDERLTGSRYLRGINRIGGVNADVCGMAGDILFTLDEVKSLFSDYMAFFTGTVSHMERLENTGRLSPDIAGRLGATGIAARASGVNDDIRTAHPYLMYGSLEFESHMRMRGDVLSRVQVRADEAECSFAMLETLLSEIPGEKSISSRPAKEKEIKPLRLEPLSGALGYVEGPRGSIFYFVKADAEGTRPLRVKARSASFCNWPVVPFAVHGNIVPDFPLINKSFNLSYSGCDL
jgi:Ni,Fe-hydrogenase III large subunit/Ni,Fe-hydrogenase III component G